MQTFYVYPYTTIDYLMPNSKRITISDVAKAAGVSIGTASRVINRREGDIKISAETRKLVLDLAQQMGYHANPFASALRTQRTGVIGVIVRDICDPFLGLLARQVQKAARAQGIDVLLAHAEYDLEVVGHHIAFMHSHWFDGLLLLGDMPGDQAVIDELAKANTPFVAVARGEQASSPLVNIDEKAGIHLGVDYLRKLGHERIAFIGNMEHGGVIERGAYFRQYFKEKGLPLDENLVQVCGNSRSSAVECAEKLFSRANRPEAVFCATDLAAWGTISGIQRAGLTIPRDVSVLGFDDVEGSADLYPALTTIRQPVGEMAERALDLLVHYIEGNLPQGTAQRVLIQPKLVIRESCAAQHTPD